jgi:hypothetical protein
MSVKTLYDTGDPTDYRAEYRALVGLAREVRHAQRAYFRERTDIALRRSKELERRLDKLLAEATE